MSRSDTIYLSDRISVDDPAIPSDVRDSLHRHGYVEDRKVYFCGLMWISGKLVVFLPRNHEGSTESRAISTHYLLRSLLKFHRISYRTIPDESDEAVVIGGESLSTADWLLNDYFSNGLYVRRARVISNNSGKVNWSRTVARQTAFPSANGSVYLEFFTSKLRFHTECITSQIHAEVIRELYSSLGLLLKGQMDFPDLRLVGIPAPSGVIELWISYLRKELQLSYSERDIFLIRRLIQYLENKKGSSPGRLVIGIRKFHSMWETMLNECLEGKISVNNLLPIPAYLTNSGELKVAPRKGQRTDTVLLSRDGTKLAVVDAKYYEASGTDNAPGWPDLVKQFFYHQSLSKLFSNKQVSNHFIFPGSTKQNLKTVFILQRDSELSGLPKILNEYAPIYCHYQDPLQLLRNYARGEKLKIFTSKLFMIAASPSCVISDIPKV